MENTVKSILSANRESVISSIKWEFKIYKNEAIVKKMVEFLAFCEENMNVEGFAASKRVKSDLKMMVSRMHNEQIKESNIKTFGTAKPKLADIMGKIADREEENGNVWNPILSEWVKK